uniref:Secreted protein n=1 Tax=Setaria viridis TaxID=4556 RepID=A0A4U6TYB4_SETVI|nr:hypothetical protein SEVIR_6G000325v2 [Setaria viridis]
MPLLLFSYFSILLRVLARPCCACFWPVVPVLNDSYFSDSYFYAYVSPSICVCIWVCVYLNMHMECAHCHIYPRKTCASQFLAHFNMLIVIYS